MCCEYDVRLMWRDRERKRETKNRVGVGRAMPRVCVVNMINVRLINVERPERERDGATETERDGDRLRETETDSERQRERKRFEILTLLHWTWGATNSIKLAKANL